MKTLYMAAAALGILAVTTAAQAEIICTQHGGCYETGGRIIYGDGGGVTSGVQQLNSYRNGKKEPVRIRRNFQVN
jgi:hypothetical protein